MVVCDDMMALFALVAAFGIIRAGDDRFVDGYFPSFVPRPTTSIVGVSAVGFLVAMHFQVVMAEPFLLFGKGNTSIEGAITTGAPDLLCDTLGLKHSVCLP